MFQLESQKNPTVLQCIRLMTKLRTILMSDHSLYIWQKGQICFKLTKNAPRLAPRWLPTVWIESIKLYFDIVSIVRLPIGAAGHASYCPRQRVISINGLSDGVIISSSFSSSLILQRSTMGGVHGRAQCNFRKLKKNPKIYHRL